MHEYLFRHRFYIVRVAARLYLHVFGVHRIHEGTDEPRVGTDVGRPVAVTQLYMVRVDPVKLLAHYIKARNLIDS